MYPTWHGVIPRSKLILKLIKPVILDYKILSSQPNIFDLTTNISMDFCALKFHFVTKYPHNSFGTSFGGLLNQHIEARTKRPPLSWRIIFRSIFLNSKCYILITFWLQFFLRRHLTERQCSSDNGLTPNRRQIITRFLGDQDFMASLSRDDMKMSANGNVFRITGTLCGKIHRSPVNSPHKGQWRGALMFSLICAWINGWVNNSEAGDLRCHRAHYDAIVMS